MYPVAAVRSRELIPQTSGPNATFQKSAFYGHNSGVGTGLKTLYITSGDPVTYLYRLTNIGDTYLDVVAFSDPGPGITLGDLILLSGSEPIAPLATIIFYYEGTVASDESSVATITANPVDSLGFDLPGEPDVIRMDSSTIDVVSPALSIEKRVYEGHDNGASA